MLTFKKKLSHVCSPPKSYTARKLEHLGYICVTDSTGLAAVNLKKLPPKAAVLCEITRND